MGDRITTFRDCPKCGTKNSLECYEALSSLIKRDDCTKCGYSQKYHIKENDNEIIITAYAPDERL